VQVCLHCELRQLDGVCNHGIPSEMINAAGAAAERLTFNLSISSLVYLNQHYSVNCVVPTVELHQSVANTTPMAAFPI
jgi:hypothetical protein